MKLVWQILKEFLKRLEKFNPPVFTEGSSNLNRIFYTNEFEIEERWIEKNIEIKGRSFESIKKNMTVGKYNL